MSHTIYTNLNTYASKCDTTNIEAFHERLRELYPCVEDVTRLPHHWSPDSKAPPLGLTNNKLGCYYRSNRRSDDEDKLTAAAVKADQCIPHSCLLYYFEIKCSSMGSGGVMGVGLTSAQVPLMKLPGWSKESYGYHADDGHIYSGDGGRGVHYGPQFEQNDVIGCGYNLVEGSCFFTKNGLKIGKAFDIPATPLLYPTIGLKTYGEEIQANFGQTKFEYDIDQDLRSLRKNMTLTISDYPISDFQVWRASLHKLVQSWFIENSYPSTAEAFSRAAKLECKENLQRIQQRSQIQQSVLKGRISEAIRLTDHLCPNLLKNNPNLLFALKCRQFIELISGAENDYQANDPDLDTKLIQFGRELSEYSQQLDKFYGKNEINERMLQETIGLIAFIDPKSSYFGKLLEPKEREPISQLLNNSIVRAEKDDSYRPPLEKVFNHMLNLTTLNNSYGRWLFDRLIEKN